MQIHRQGSHGGGDKTGELKRECTSVVGGQQHFKDIAEAELADTSATKVTMPFVEDHLERVKNIMGADFWTYGLDKSNRFVIESFLKQHHRQGLRASVRGRARPCEVSDHGMNF